MGLFGLFGKKEPKRPAEAPAEKEGAELAPYSGLQVEVTAIDGRLLFVARLQGLRGGTGQLWQQSEESVEMGPEPIMVKIRGYSDRDNKAVYMEGVITPEQNRIWKAEHLKLLKTGNDRAYFRLDTNVEGTLSPSGRVGGKEEPCKLLNISIGGARVLTAAPHKAREKFLLRVKLIPDREPFLIRCELLRIISKDEKQFEYGLRFMDLNDKETERITQCIFDLQRKKNR